MKKVNLMYVWMLSVVLAASLFTSCEKEEDALVATVSVTNKGTYTLRDLSVHFVNNDNEEIGDDQLGDLAVNETKTFKTDAPKIYFGLLYNTGWKFSANYELTIGKKKEIILNDNTNWDH